MQIRTSFFSAAIVVLATLSGAVVAAPKGSPTSDSTRTMEAGAAGPAVRVSDLAVEGPATRAAWIKQQGGRASRAGKAAMVETSPTDASQRVVAGMSNDFCADAEAIEGEGPFAFDSSVNSLDGPPACSNEGQTQVDRDEWFCWTAPETPCEGEFVVSTCGRTTVDTKIAVYEGCACPPGPFTACGDDECALQTHLPFTATPGQSYLIRVGTFPASPGGPGAFTITCRPPLPCAQSGENCQSPTLLDALTSTRDLFVLADDFRPDESGDVTELCWWGTYFDEEFGLDCQGLAPDTFVVNYYADADGLPGELLASFSQDDATLLVDGPALTGLSYTSGLSQYEFSAMHGAVPVLAGECYWVEISNGVPDCTWFWDVGINRNQRAVQDGRGGTVDGYDAGDGVLDDLAFCTNLPLADTAACLPPAPPNDPCADAEPLSDEGRTFFDTSGATQDGQGHTACLAAGENQLDNDVWYCWTAPCSGQVFARTCGLTDVDSRLAVYDGCACPAGDASLITCNDDLCGGSGLQSMVVFEAVQGQSYLLRVGSYPGSPGGPGELEITCGPPDRADCPAAGPCCEEQTEAGCGNEYCCEAVCACDPFCCEVTWDAACGGGGFGGNGCGADVLCNCDAACGEPDAGSCFSANGLPSCDDAECCDAVCACDSFCCEMEWDENCATMGFGGNGCGAGVLCEELQPNCPFGPVGFQDPPGGVVDARRPTPPADAGALEGIATLVVNAPPGADPECFHLCETAEVGAANFIAGVVEHSGTYTLTLDRPMTPGAATTISYRVNESTTITGEFLFHPGNANGDALADAADVEALAAALGGTPLTHGLFGGDADRSGMQTPLDLLTLVDILNGAEAFVPWLGTSLPAAAPDCP